MSDNGSCPPGQISIHSERLQLDQPLTPSRQMVTYFHLSLAPCIHPLQRLGPALRGIVVWHSLTQGFARASEIGGGLVAAARGESQLTTLLPIFAFEPEFVGA